MVLALFLLPSPVGADRLDVRAKYEEVLIAEALLRHHLRSEEPAPEGQIIEAVIIDDYPVILPEDFPLSNKIPWTLLNKVHVTTRRQVIERELLFRPGQPYQKDLIEESGRNLRNYLFVSVARIVTARGSRPGQVVVVVVTKDEWSLRLNTNFVLDQARIDSLSFSISENNFLGRNKALALNFALDAGRYTLGLTYNDPRLWGSRHAATASANMYLSRDTGLPEGVNTSLVAGRPLYSLHTEWGWQASFGFSQSKVRDLCAGAVADYTVAAGAVTRTCVGSGAVPPSGEQIPGIFGATHFTGTLQGTRSFGVLHKVNLTAGFSLQSDSYNLTDEFPGGTSANAQRTFVGSLLPRSESASGPFVALHAFTGTYVRLKDINTFALTEDFRLGPDLQLQVRHASHTLGLSSDYVELSGSYGHMFLIGDDLLSYSAALSGRLQDGVLPGTGLVNEEVDASVRNVSPRVGPLRLHIAGQMALRYHDLTHARFALGDGTGLRGFGSRAIQGGSFYRVNVELRTTALNLWTVHVGGVVFYDGGDAPVTPPWQSVAGYPHLSDWRQALDEVLRPPAVRSVPLWHQDAGIGLRVLIPQFNRNVLRMDLAFPFEIAAGGYVPHFSASFDQAF